MIIWQITEIVHFINQLRRNQKNAMFQFRIIANFYYNFFLLTVHKTEQFSISFVLFLENREIFKQLMLYMAVTFIFFISFQSFK